MGSRGALGGQGMERKASRSLRKLLESQGGRLEAARLPVIFSVEYTFTSHT